MNLHRAIGIDVRHGLVAVCQRFVHMDGQTRSELMVIIHTSRMDFHTLPILIVHMRWLPFIEEVETRHILNTGKHGLLPAAAEVNGDAGINSGGRVVIRRQCRLQESVRSLDADHIFRAYDTILSRLGD